MDEKNQNVSGYDYATQAAPAEPAASPTPVAETPAANPPAPRFPFPPAKKS